MNEQERSELERLKQRHARLQEEVALLAGQLKRLEAQITTPAVVPTPASVPIIPRIEPTPVKRAEPPPMVDGGNGLVPALLRGAADFFNERLDLLGRGELLHPLGLVLDQLFGGFTFHGG